MKTTCDTVAVGATTADGTVCGGGSAEVPEETPTLAAEETPEVAGGGSPETTPVAAVGGGGPELPFTGLPLSYAIYAGLGLLFVGIALWLRARTGAARG